MSNDHSKKEEKKPENPGNPQPSSNPNPPGNPDGPGKPSDAPGNGSNGDNLRSLTFVVNGDDEIVDKVNLNQPLKVAQKEP